MGLLSCTTVLFFEGVHFFQEQLIKIHIIVNITVLSVIEYILVIS